MFYIKSNLLFLLKRSLQAKRKFARTLFHIIIIKPSSIRQIWKRW